MLPFMVRYLSWAVLFTMCTCCILSMQFASARCLDLACRLAALLKRQVVTCVKLVYSVSNVLHQIHAGVKLSSGEDIAADLVIDASGGRSHAIAQFLHSKCGQTVESAKYRVNLSYHTRFFRIPDKVSLSIVSCINFLAILGGFCPSYAKQ